MPIESQNPLPPVVSPGILGIPTYPLNAVTLPQPFLSPPDCPIQGRSLPDGVKDYFWNTDYPVASLGDAFPAPTL